MKEAGIPEEQIQTIVWENPIAFFGQSGRLDFHSLDQDQSIDQRQLWEGNSVLRGQTPIVQQ